MNHNKSKLTFIAYLLCHFAFGQLSWSPDGKQIVFASSLDGDSEIFLTNSDGTNLKKLTENNSSDITPEWSSDGKLIFFTSYRTGSSQIFCMNADGSSQRNLTNTDSDEWEAQISPDGKKILFMSLRHEFGQLYTIDTDGSNQNRITNTSTAATFPKWAPNSENIVFAEFSAFRTDGRKTIQMIGSIEEKDFKPLFEKTSSPTTVLDWINDDECIIQEKFVDQVDQFGAPKYISIVYTYNVISKKKTKFIKKANNVSMLDLNPTNSNKAIFISGGPPAFNSKYSAYFFDAEQKKPKTIGPDFRFGKWSPDGKSIALTDGNYIAITDAGGQSLRYLNK